MVADPWSAASRPMLPFDALPSRPLRFADTLQPIDPNATVPKLPRPKRHVEQIKSYPVPAYSHTRDESASLQETILKLNIGPTNRVVGSDEWMQDEVAKCVDSAKGDLDIAGRGLRVLSTKISDMRHLVTLPSTYSPKPRTPAYPNLSLGSPHNRAFSRTASAPASSALFSRQRTPSNVAPPLLEEQRRVTFNVAAGPSTPPRPTKRTFGRSQTGAVDLHSRAKEINIYAGQNQLTTLPSALFDISNLTLLSLRGNQLTSLPAAVGELRHLRDLNISNNQITELPFTILQLDLTLFTAHPNKFHPEEPEPRITRHYDSPVPRLTTICTDLLLSVRAPSRLPALLDLFDWGHANPLDPSTLEQILPHVADKDIARVVQALQSASARANVTTPRHAADDACTNPFFCPCPSTRHQEIDQSPTRHIFLHPAEERLEWREVFGTSALPVRWMGCSPGCLGFLDDENDEWEIDSV